VDKPDPVSGRLNLLPRYFLLITNWPNALRSGEQVLAHYRKRGTFEDRLGEFNEVIGPHLSSREFVENEVTMLLALLAFNLTSMLRNEFEDLKTRWVAAGICIASSSRCCERAVAWSSTLVVCGSTSTKASVRFGSC